MIYLLQGCSFPDFSGRDGKPSKCILFYKLGDLHRLSTMVFVERTGLSKLYNMADYCIDMKTCRRKLISRHFDEKWEDSDCRSMCDHCQGTPNLTKDVSIYAQTVIRIILKANDLSEKLTPLKLLNSLLSSGPQKLQVKDWKCPKNDFNRAIGERLLAHMLLRGYIKEDFHYTPYSTLTYLVMGDTDLDLPINIDILPSELP